MRLGVLSDSHGHIERTRQAVSLLIELKSDVLIHCGDVGVDSAGADVLIALAGHGIPAYFVWGNNDWPPGLSASSRPGERFIEQLGLTPPGEPPLRLCLQGVRVLVAHGHERIYRTTQSQAADGQLQAELVLSGHTHVPANDLIGRVAFVNPGALTRARQYTVCTIDLPSLSVEHHVVA